jgi:Domain of unknown function (DUF5664)
MNNFLKHYFTDEVVENADGGKQTAIKTAFHLIPSIVLFKIAETLHQGSLKYETDNWKLIPIDIHLGRSVQHIYAFLGGDTTEDHLSHALCRLIFAAAMHYECL